MKLYYAPGACSLASHIVLRETDRAFELERVDNKAKRTASGADFWKINPKGYVPVLELDDGQRLTESVAVLQYLGDARPNLHLTPPPGSFERVRLQEHLNFIAAELHPAFRPFFGQGSEDAKQAAKDKIRQRLGFFEQHVFSDRRPYLLGEQLSVADIYFFVITNWTRRTQVPIEDMPGVMAFLERIGSREKVREAMQAEGLI